MVALAGWVASSAVAGRSRRVNSKYKKELLQIHEVTEALLAQVMKDLKCNTPIDKIIQIHPQVASDRQPTANKQRQHSNTKPTQTTS
jgi:hypothetical protein